MAVISAITGALASLNASKNILETMIDLRDAAVFQEKRFELQSKIMDAQGSVFTVNEERTALIERVGSLEKEIGELKAWEADKQRYELKDLGNGSLAYALKPDAQPPEPHHSLCATCYQRGKKSILQPETRFPGRSSVLVCFECGADLYLNGGRYIEHHKPSARK